MAGNPSFIYSWFTKLLFCLYSNLRIGVLAKDFFRTCIVLPFSFVYWGQSRSLTSLQMLRQYWLQVFQRGGHNYMSFGPKGNIFKENCYESRKNIFLSLLSVLVLLKKPVFALNRKFESTKQAKKLLALHHSIEEKSKFSLNGKKTV